MKQTDDGQAVSKTQGYTARNRENQRNFRKRRQERIQELEDKVRQVQNARIEATKEVQAAARSVAAENGILKAYLKEKLGMSEFDILELVQSRQSRGANRAPHNHVRSDPASPLTSLTGQSHTAIPPEHWNSNLWPCTTAAKFNVSDVHTSSSTRRDVPSIVPHGREGLVDGVDHKILETQMSGTALPICPTSPQNNTVSMSCEKAAEILSEIHNGNAADELRFELGCTSMTTCKVKNIRLLEIMSET